jgi:hypothetical protein
MDVHIRYLRIRRVPLPVVKYTSKFVHRDGDASDKAERRHYVSLALNPLRIEGAAVKVVHVSSLRGCIVCLVGSSEHPDCTLVNFIAV